MLRNSAVIVFAAVLTVPFVGAQNQAPANDSPFGGVTVEEIIARINDQIITRSDYERAMKEYDTEARQHGETMQQISDAHKDLLRNLIDQQLWLSKGKDLGITGETELIKRLDELRKQYNLETLEDLEKAAREQGISYEDFKQNIRNGIVTQEVMREQIGGKIRFTPGEVQRYYDQHKQEYSRPESVKLQEILIAVGKEAPKIGSQATTDTDPAKLAEAKVKADDIESRLKAGGDFAQLARTFSDGTTAAQGGDLGDFRRGALAKLLEDKTFSLKAGEYTEPIHTKQGYVILKVVEHVQGGVPAFKDVEQQVEEAFYMTRMEPAMRDYLTEMREESFIDIKPGYADSGASAKQTKPVFGSYTPPQPKKKKKVERVRYRDTTRTFRQKSAPVGGATPVETKAAATTPADSKATAAAATKKPVKAPVAKAQKAGKREKVRYGQAPRETLPASADETKKEDAGALTPEQTATTQEPASPFDAKAPTQKTRYSARAKEVTVAKKKQKDVTKQAEQAANGSPEDAAEIADRHEQAAPLGLGGNTAPSKKKKLKTAAGTKGEKTRLSDEKKTDDKKKADTTTPPTTPDQTNTQPK